MEAERKEMILRKLRGIAASANDAQDYVAEIDAFGARLESIDEDLADIVRLLEGGSV